MTAFRISMCLAVVAGALAGAAENCRAADPAPGNVATLNAVSFDALGAEYRDQTHPLLARFCLDCHAAAMPEGELDLEQFAALADVRRHPRIWQKVAEMLDNGEMPPKDSDQPTPAERSQLRDWVGRYLHAEALATAGDPGRVVLRRLNNFEYTNSVRDLTGVPLEPAKEFPVDGAAGEGFTNTGESLVMSPALLTKYLDAGKEIARHAVLLPDGFRFSPSIEPGDWHDEYLAAIRQEYARYADGEGQIPLDKYFAATITEREALTWGAKTVATVSAEQGLSPKYLGILWEVLSRKTAAGDADYAGSFIDTLRQVWRTARVEDVGTLCGMAKSWQTVLWKTNTVGHMKPWHVPVDPVVSAQEVRLKLKAAPDADEVTIYLATGDAGDGATGDVVVWQNPRIEFPTRAPLALRDVRGQSEALFARRKEVLAATGEYLAATAQAQKQGDAVDVAALAAERKLDPEALAGWLDYVGILPQGAVTIDQHFANKIDSTGGYDFVKGWGSQETPNLIANSSDQEVHVPGTMKPHAVAVHPAPTVDAVVGWQSPIDATVAVTAHVARAHTACGNGITWSLELRRGKTRSRLAGGNSDQLKSPAAGPLDNIQVHRGDVFTLAIGPRDGNHGCDLTEIDLVVSTTGPEAREWRLTRDISSDVAAANPHADTFGNQGVWHFFTQPVSADGQWAPVIPAGSLLAQWRDAQDPAAKQKLAADVQNLLTAGRPTGGSEADQQFYRQATSLTGPLFGRLAETARTRADTKNASSAGAASPWGMDTAAFGKRPDGKSTDVQNLVVNSQAVVAVKIPADLVTDGQFVATCVLDPELGTEGSVQPRVAQAEPDGVTALLPGVPVLGHEGSAAARRIKSTLAETRRLFPAAACYVRIVPVDEAVTLQLLHREDDAYCELMLDDAQHAKLDRLWDELRYISADAPNLRDAFEQLMEYATQDSDPGLFEPFRKQIYDGVTEYEARVHAAEPLQLQKAIEFAGRAYRRPLTSQDEQELRALYQKLRADELSHEDALRLVLARAFVAPTFLYKLEQAGSGKEAQPVSDWELASRLSYFLRATMPDDELRGLAAAGRLHEPDVLAAQARRLLSNDPARSLATEFACQFLDVRDFHELDEKSESHFPTFVDLRGDMYEETVRFFADLFDRDGSVIEILNADHTFLNNRLAEFYGVPGVTGPEWRRVDGVSAYGRGGILGFSTTLAKNSGASRTSPILRGNWLLEMVLGEKLPKPPKDVPQLPEDETATDGLTVRQLVEKHRSLGQCSVCHAKLDPFGFALESYDAIGRRRDKDLGDRPIDTAADLPDGSHIEGLEGLRAYLVKERQQQFLRHFCKKLLGYALGRGLQLSDEPTVDEMLVQLSQQNYKFSAAVDVVVRSRQFRYHRAVDVGEEP